MTHVSQHERCVDEWLGTLPTNLSREQLIELVGDAFAAVCQRAQRSLGEVMLAAIVDRVVFSAAEQFPQLRALEIDATGVRFHARADFEVTHDEGIVLVALRFLLRELLTVLERVTGGILSDSLCVELRSVQSRKRNHRGPAPVQRAHERQGDDDGK